MLTIKRIAFVVPALLLVAACGAGAPDAIQSDSTGSSSSVAPGAPELNSPDSATRDLAGGGDDAKAQLNDGDTQFSANPAADTKADTQTKAVISKGQVSVTTKDIEKTRFNLQRLLDGWGGSISNEETNADAKGKTSDARIEVRVPSDKFGVAMTEIAKLGKLTQRTRTSEDVTTQVIDTDVRVRAQEKSLQRMEALLAQAKDLNEVISIEAQLSRRQADLDSLKSQQKYLADQTSQATIGVYLSTPEKAAEKDDNGFVAGLKDGWNALKDSTVAVLTATGAVLPFAVLIALIGFPIGYLIKRRLHAPSAAPAAPAEA